MRYFFAADLFCVLFIIDKLHVLMFSLFSMCVCTTFLYDVIHTSLLSLLLCSVEFVGSYIIDCLLKFHSKVEAL